MNTVKVVAVDNAIRIEVGLCQREIVPDKVGSFHGKLAVVGHTIPAVGNEREVSAHIALGNPVLYTAGALKVRYGVVGKI